MRRRESTVGWCLIHLPTVSASANRGWFHQRPSTAKGNTFPIFSLVRCSTKEIYFPFGNLHRKQEEKRETVVCADGSEVAGRGLLVARRKSFAGQRGGGRWSGVAGLVDVDGRGFEVGVASELQLYPFHVRCPRSS